MFKEDDKKSRQRVCDDRFNFNCYCDPCIKNWPTLKFIPDRLSTLYVTYLNFIIVIMVKYYDYFMLIEIF